MGDFNQLYEELHKIKQTAFLLSNGTASQSHTEILNDQEPDEYGDVDKDYYWILDSNSTSELMSLFNSTSKEYLISDIAELVYSHKELFRPVGISEYKDQIYYDDRRVVPSLNR